MITVTNAFKKCLENFNKPHTIVTDNGAEFTSYVFTDLLKDRQIRHHRIKVGTPQENGKIERFWKTLEKSIKRRDQLDFFRNEYNKFWYHKGLKEYTKEKLTPQQAWDKMVPYTNQPDPKIFYY